MSKKFYLKWNNHMNNMMNMLKSSLLTEEMVDVTLACDGLSLKAHKMVLSASSRFFQSLFLENPCKHPIVILNDMKYTDVKAILEFMYHGELIVAQENLTSLMKTAATLRVKGLAEVTNVTEEFGDDLSTRPSSGAGTPPLKRRKKKPQKRSTGDQRDDGTSVSKSSRHHQDADIKELSSDMDNSTTIPYSDCNKSTSAVPSTQTHHTTSFHKSQQEQQQQPQPVVNHPDDSFVQKEKSEVEPGKLLQQTLMADDILSRMGRSSVQSNLELQRQSQCSTDHSIVDVASTSVFMSSDALVSAHQQSESPVDLEPPISTVAGPSRSADKNAIVHMYKSNESSVSGPSGYENNSGALVTSDSQPQGEVADKETTLFGVKSSLRSNKMTVANEGDMEVKKKKINLDSKRREEKKGFSKIATTKKCIKKKSGKCLQESDNTNVSRCLRSRNSDVKSETLAAKQSVGQAKRKNIDVGSKKKENKIISNDAAAKKSLIESGKSTEESNKTYFGRTLHSKMSDLESKKLVANQSDTDSTVIRNNLAAAWLHFDRSVNTGDHTLTSNEMVFTVVDTSPTKMPLHVCKEKRNYSKLGTSAVQNDSAKNDSERDASRTIGLIDLTVLPEAKRKNIDVGSKKKENKIISNDAAANPTGMGNNLGATRPASVRSINTGALSLMSNERIPTVIGARPTKISGHIFQENRSYCASPTGLSEHIYQEKRNYSKLGTGVRQYDSAFHATRTISVSDPTLLPGNNFAAAGLLSVRSINKGGLSIMPNVAVPIMAGARPTRISGSLKKNYSKSQKNYQGNLKKNYSTGTDVRQNDLARNDSSVDPAKTTSLGDPTLLPGFDGQQTEDPQNQDVSVDTKDHCHCDGDRTIPMGALGMVHLLQPYFCGICRKKKYAKKYKKYCKH